MVVAFHNEPKLKDAVMQRLREHRRLDRIVQGVYQDDQGRGCHLGCLTNSNTDVHRTAERLFGIEMRIGYWLECVFEGLPKEEDASWVIESTDAIPVGADMSLCHHHFCAWLLGESGILSITNANRAVINTVIDLHVRAAAGDCVLDEEWSAARAAAESATARSAAAWSAEWAAAWSARSAARSAAEWSVARSAAEWSTESAWSVARWAAAAAFQKMACKSIEIFSTAPVISGSMDSDVERELCRLNLWCCDDKSKKREHTNA